MLSDAQTRWHLASLQVGWHAEPGLGSHTHCAGNAARLCSSERVQQPVRLAHLRVSHLPSVFAQ